MLFCGVITATKSSEWIPINLLLTTAKWSHRRLPHNKHSKNKNDLQFSKVVFLLIYLRKKDSIYDISRSDEIGNHARLKIVCRKAWEFKSPLRHNKIAQTAIFLRRRAKTTACLCAGDLKVGAMPSQGQARRGRGKFLSQHKFISDLVSPPA